MNQTLVHDPDTRPLRARPVRFRAVTLGVVAWLPVTMLVSCGGGTQVRTSPVETAVPSPTTTVSTPTTAVPTTAPTSTTIPDVVVANIVGLSRDCAEQLLSERGLRWRYQGTKAVRSVPIGMFSEPAPRAPTILIVPDSAYPTPEVLSQDPPLGTRVRPGAVVVFSTRGGPELLEKLPLRPPAGVPGPAETCRSSLDERRRTSP